MQVSWIDPDELNELAQQLLDSQATGRQPQVQSMPDASMLGADNLVDGPIGSTTAAPKPSLPALEQIRAKLRSIRDRAKSAGLLPDAPPAPPAPLAAPPAPEARIPTPTAPQPSSLFKQSAQIQPAIPTPTTFTAHASTSQPPTQTDSAEDEVDEPFQPKNGTIAERLHDFCIWASRKTHSEDLVVIDHHGDILWGVPSREDLLLQSIVLINRTLLQPTRSETDALQTVDRYGKFHSVVPVATKYGSVFIILITQDPPTAWLLSSLRNDLAISIDKARFP